MRSGARACALLVALGALPGCSPEEAPAAPVRLSTADPDSNAPAVADFVRRTCLHAMNDPDAFLAALRRSGWAARQKQEADATTPLAVWTTAHGEIIYSMQPMELPAGKAWDCSLVVAPEAAPSAERMRAALLPVLRHPTLETIEGGAADFAWQWRPSPYQQRDLTISASTSSESDGNTAARPGLSIHVSGIELDPVRSLLGN